MIRTLQVINQATAQKANQAAAAEDTPKKVHFFV
jgi:hypothetical protein